MVKVWPNVWFDADFPDDTVYDESGDELQFAGQAVARTIAELLQARGYELEEPQNEEHLGWSFIAYRLGESFWMLLTFIDGYILQTKDRAWRVFSRQGEYLDFLTDLEACLKSDPRFSNLRWWVKDWPPDEGESVASPLG